MKVNHDKCHLLVTGKNSETKNAYGSESRNSYVKIYLKQRCIVSWSLKIIEILLLKEAVVRRCSVEKLFLGISLNSQKNTCVGLGNRCFPVNFVKFLRIHFSYLFLITLSKVLSFMSSEKRRILINSFMKSLFNYCPLFWIFHSCTINSKINHLHKRCLRLIYNDNTSSFKELLERDRSVPKRNRNLEILDTEMFKLYSNSADFWWNF